MSQKNNVSIMGQQIKKLRTEKGLNQKEFGLPLGIGQVDVSRYENGSVHPGIDILMKIADTYNVSLDWLCGRITDNSIQLSLTQELDG